MNIYLNNLHKSFGGKRVFSGLNLTFPAGQATCLMGPSGSGKTTILRMLMGLEKPDGGQIGGITKSMHISAVFQEDRLCEGFSAMANVRLACPGAAAEAIEAQLCAVGLKGSLSQPVRQLSGGMKRRVAIVRAVMADYDLMLLDEPFKGLDEATRKTVAGYLMGHISGKTTIMVAHDAQDAALMSACVIKLPE